MISISASKRRTIRCALVAVSRPERPAAQLWQFGRDHILEEAIDELPEFDGVVDNYRQLSQCIFIALLV